nr:MAG TPA: prohead serine protease [Caudoviricetes sp.]
MSGITLSIARLSVDERRKMRGVAYAGGVLSYFGDSIAIDLDSLKFDGKQIPLLRSHDRDRVVGYGHLMREGNALIVEGEMLNNDHASEITSAADEGLEWQMSVHIESRRTLTRHAGDVVNGQPLTVDDVTVLADGVIREVSFTPTGVDADTSARILSLSLTKPNQEPEMNKELEQQVATLSAEKATLAAENETLKQQLAEQATAAKLAQLSALGVEGERAAKLAKADDDTFSALVEQIQLSAKQSAVLSASYEGGAAPETRPNPLLRA